MLHDETHVRLAVVSDLHAYDDAPGDVAPSHLCIKNPENQPGTHPIAGLNALIASEALKADLLLCPGDLGHQAKPAAIKCAWRWLCDLRSALSATRLIPTAGNHDLDSRYHYNSFDAKGVLQSLVPRFPFDDEILSDRFWSRNFVVITEPEYNIVVLNSSAYHGTAPNEILHGRVAEATLEALRLELEGRDFNRVNLLLCHHHPLSHMELKLGDYDVMKNGQLLLDLLGSGTLGRWLVVHGHKHHPKLTYAQGTATAPIILSAASLSAALYPELAASARNQFHFITIPHGTGSSGLVGTIRSWNWAPGLAWAPAAPGSGLPALCGFGNREDPATLAQEISGSINAPKMSWAALREALPRIDHLLPGDFQTLLRELGGRGIAVLFDQYGLPQEIGRTP